MPKPPHRARIRGRDALAPRNPARSGRPALDWVTQGGFDPEWELPQVRPAPFCGKEQDTSG